MWLNASCSLKFQIPVPTPFLFMLRPRSGWQQWIAREEYVLSPSVPAIEFTDPFGDYRLDAFSVFLCLIWTASSGQIED